MIPISTNPSQPGTWRFALFGVPVAVHWVFWLIAVLLGPLEWANSPVGVKLLLVWVAVVFVSILVHEFGHAFAFRRYGGRPQVLLYGLGGLASAPGRYNRNQSIVITLGGPVVQLVLASVFYLWLKVGPPIENLYVGYLVVSMVRVNFFWAILNLLPILPLDGGRLLGHLMHDRRPMLRAQIGAGCAAAVGLVLFAYTNSIFNLVLFGFLAYMNYQAARGSYR